jgi:thiol-disulfide isomerase/thioredoxin
MLCGFALPQEPAKQEPPKQEPAKPPANGNSSAPSKKNQPTELTEQQELQKGIDDAGNDRAALVKNLEAFLKKYPESPQRPRIYRALVESDMQLRDFAHATDYAERMVALNPNDISTNVLAIQLIDRYGDVPGYRRAVFYCSRVMENVEHTPPTEKSPRVSPEDWEAAKKRDRASLLLIRADLYHKLNDIPNDQKDLEESYALVPNANAAERLGELAELNKNLEGAIQNYARAFALTDATNGAPSRPDLRKKIGNVWRLAHGSEDGLGDYLLHAFDITIAATAKPKPPRNPDAKEPYDFVLRKVTDATQVHLADVKGKVLVLNFWATWCGPCKELEPHFEKIAEKFSSRNDVVFYALNCDDDESLVLPFVQVEKPKTTTLFADGLERLLGVNSFPTTLVLDRTGKIAFRSDGFDSEGFEKSISDAIERVSQTVGTTAASASAKH